MSEYNIEDIKLGNHNIVKAYKGDDLIFDRNREEYIQCVQVYNEHTDVGYIPVTGVELYADYRYEVDVEFGTPEYTFSTLIGGSNTDAGGYGQGASCGFFLGAFRTQALSGECAVGINDFDSELWPWGPPYVKCLPDCLYEFPHEEGELPIFPQRQAVSFYNPDAEPWQVNTLTGRDRKRMTTGGFYLLGGRCGLNNPATPYDDGYARISSFFGNNGKVYRISIYDTNGTTLLMNFKPKIQNGHIGMVDTVSGTFYPCNDDTLFRIAKR